MAHAEGMIAIDRPIKTVFDFVLDGTNSLHWRPDVTDITLMPGKPLGVGAVFKQGAHGPTGRIDADYEIVECRPNEWIKFQVIAGPARPVGTYKFESTAGGTSVTFALDFQPKGLARLMDGMITSTMRGEIGNLSNLKTYLETH